MEDRKFFNSTHPQTLQIAVFLLYINAFFAVLSFLGGFAGGPWALIGLAFLAGFVGGGYGIANEKKWGYQIAVTVAVAILGLRVLSVVWTRSLAALIYDPIGLIFAIALVALLLHSQSKEYVKLWFR